jgi:hypothetical protein
VAAARAGGLPSSSQADDDWRSLLLCKEPCHIRHTFEDESPGMPWARAKFQVCLGLLLLPLLPCVNGASWSS